ncbi:MAG: hypothetical protein AMJ90_04350 [candidate division Zixibacteria bacterium SM23_73_2]|nr:MAG: hypothetical protein AMJ90_04350 [candidate division Zixibacteria bacterium SM23_73_2]
MKHQGIIDAVDNSIKILHDEFKSQPSLFFTEDDLVCYLYQTLQQKLPIVRTPDKDDHQHFLIHKEYPTPFRCDMAGTKFEIKNDEERTEKGGKYKRGYYDLIVLNPDFIRQYTYDEIKAQDYESYKEKVLSKIELDTPVILYGLEFMFSRDPLKFSRGTKEDKGINQFVAKVNQDANKLKESKNYKGFMKNIKMIVFVKDSKKEICDSINKKLSKRQEILPCFA